MAAMKRLQAKEATVVWSNGMYSADSDQVGRTPNIEGGLRGKFGAEKRGAGATVSPTPVAALHYHVLTPARNGVLYDCG
jgi:hypothetical protein